MLTETKARCVVTAVGDGETVGFGVSVGDAVDDGVGVTATGVLVGIAVGATVGVACGVILGTVVTDGEHTLTKAHTCPAAELVNGLSPKFHHLAR